MVVVLCTLLIGFVAGLSECLFVVVVLGILLLFCKTQSILNHCLLLFCLFLCCDLFVVFCDHEFIYVSVSIIVRAFLLVCISLSLSLSLSISLSLSLSSSLCVYV